MNVRTSPDDLAAMQFGIGQPVKRQEDPILVRGEGSYTDDVSLPGQLYAAFVRSPYAHGVLKSMTPLQKLPRRWPASSRSIRRPTSRRWITAR